MKKFQQWRLRLHMQQAPLRNSHRLGDEGVTLVELLAATIITGLVTSVIGFGLGGMT